MTSAIKIDYLSKTYPRSWATPAFEAIKGISLEVAQGEVFGFIGPNGAGKSTTIKVLTGMSHPTSGSATIFGIDVHRPESRRGLGYVTENPSLPNYLTPLEILRTALHTHQIRLHDEITHCLKWLERFELAQVANKPIRGFSKGMTQRTALAHAMVVMPRLLILDEPLSGLDPVGRRDVVDILAEYKAQGGTIFLTSHVLHDVERLADCFGLIHKGEIKTIASPAELLGTNETLIVRSLGSTSVSGMRQDTPGRWYGEVPRDKVWLLLEELKQADHRIIEIKPRLDLETAFLHHIGHA